MKLLLFSDLHLDAPFSWLARKPAVARKRRLAIRSALESIVGLAAERKVDAVLCGGDLFEQSRLTQDTVAFLRDQLSAFSPAPVFIAPGNHDYLCASSPYLGPGMPGNVRLFTEDRLVPIELAGGLALWGAGHRAPAYTDNFLANFRPDRGGVNLALFHGSEITRDGFGAEQSAYAPFRSQDITSAGLSHAFLGHIHTPKATDLFTYPGNPEPLSFGESGNRGVVIADIGSDGRLVREFICVSSSAVHDVEVDVSGCTSKSAIQTLIRERADGLSGVLRITLLGSIEPDVELVLPELEDAIPQMDAVVIRASNLRRSYDLDAIAREPTVRGKFARDVLESDLPAEERNRILVTGLRALEGRSDLEVI